MKIKHIFDPSMTRLAKRYKIAKPVCPFPILAKDLEGRPVVNMKRGISLFCSTSLTGIAISFPAFLGLFLPVIATVFIISTPIHWVIFFFVVPIPAFTGAIYLFCSIAWWLESFVAGWTLARLYKSIHPFLMTDRVAKYKSVILMLESNNRVTAIMTGGYKRVFLGFISTFSAAIDNVMLIGLEFLLASRASLYHGENYTTKLRDRGWRYAV